MKTNERPRVTEAEEIKVALHDMVSLANQLAMKVIVLEATVAEMISSMPTHQQNTFARTFKARIADLMQQHSDRLLPSDDAEISLSVANVLRAASPR